MRRSRSRVRSSLHWQSSEITATRAEIAPRVRTPQRVCTASSRRASNGSVRGRLDRPSGGAVRGCVQRGQDHERSENACQQRS